MPWARLCLSSLLHVQFIACVATTDYAVCIHTSPCCNGTIDRVCSCVCIQRQKCHQPSLCRFCMWSKRDHEYMQVGACLLCDRGLSCAACVLVGLLLCAAAELAAEGNGEPTASSAAEAVTAEPVSRSAAYCPPE